MLDIEIGVRKRKTARRYVFFAAVFLPLAFFVYSIAAFEPQGMPWMLVTLMAIYVLILVFALGAFLARDRIVGRAIRAVPMPQEYRIRLDKCTESISLASGIGVPEVMFIDREGINSYAMGKKERGVIFVTRGLLASLDQYELQALIAHEMARIGCGYSYATAFKAALGGLLINLNATLGSLLGLMLTTLGVLLTVLVFLALIPHFLLDTGAGGIELVVYFLVFLPLALIIFWAFQSGDIDSYNQFLLADELAVKWTIHPDALISALHKMRPLYTEKPYGFLQGMAFVPCIPGRSRGRRNPDTPIVVTATREANMPSAVRTWFSRSPYPDVSTRFARLQEAIGHPF
ncbi:MAG: M48 family metalloprotease [Actinobacteria bacterium]|nr:M48 family metalloprotease [Actinomycetota bacterium]